MDIKTVWRGTDIKGQLFLETVLVEGNEPVLFTCVDIYEQRYLIEMLDSFEGRYLVVSIDTNDLLDMLRDNLTLEQTFKKQKEAYLTSFDDNFDLILEAVRNSEIPDEYLPLPGIYFELSTPNIHKYIEQLSDSFSANYHVAISCYDSVKATFSSSFNMIDVFNILSNNDYESFEHTEDLIKKVAPLETSNLQYNVDILQEESLCKAA